MGSAWGLCGRTGFQHALSLVLNVEILCMSLSYLTRFTDHNIFTLHKHVILTLSHYLACLTDLVIVEFAVVERLTALLLRRDDVCTVRRLMTTTQHDDRVPRQQTQRIDGTLDRHFKELHVIYSLEIFQQERTRIRK